LRTPPGWRVFVFKRTSYSPRSILLGGALFYFLLKERAVPIKQPIMYLVILTILTACQKDPISPSMQPGLTPSVSGLASIEIDDNSRELIREHLGVFLDSKPYTEYETGGQLLTYLVSSGEFAQAEISLESGEMVQADVIYAYTLMSTRQVLVVPLLVGLSLSEGMYVYFSENYSLDNRNGAIPDGIDRETALADAAERLPRGHIFRLLAYGMVTPSGLDWKKCQMIALYPAEICPVGQLVEQLYPNQTKTFVLHLADEFPSGWMLMGWFFKEFTPGELVPGAKIDVPLSEISQP
jgi:hypothetical protein